MHKPDIINFYDTIALKRNKWKRFNRFYHKQLENYFSLSVPENSNIIELGCGTGNLLNALKPKRGVGMDFSEKMVEIARQKYPQYEFRVMDAEYFEINEKFDYIILSDLVNCLLDIQAVFQNLKNLCNPNTRIIISYYNPAWEFVIKFIELIGLKQKQPLHTWLSIGDLSNLLYLEDFEIIKKERKLLIPKYIPVLNLVFNKFLGNLPFINRLNLINFIVARPLLTQNNEYSVSIIVPARNEKGNIENAILRTPKFGLKQEFVFVEGNSFDNTWEEILRVKEKYKESHHIITLKQSGKGKGNAVREAFEKASGEVLMILDADLTTPPEDMVKFYHAIASNKGELINGCRLVYPMEKEAMRFLNLMGNKFFGYFFSYLLGQRLKDTLCGTKVLFQADYQKIKANRGYFGNFDPFGDFDLLFGAAKLNLKITEVIVRYKDREYGSTQISRFRHGLLLLKMSFFAAFKLKFK